MDVDDHAVPSECCDLLVLAGISGRVRATLPRIHAVVLGLKQSLLGDTVYRWRRSWADILPMPGAGVWTSA
jgi:hypothetical protein